jgi:hypothetical protein
MAHVFQSEPVCKNCNYPLQGTTDEQQRFLNEREISQIEFETHEKQIRSAGRELYWIAAITFLGNLFYWGMNRGQIDVRVAVGFGSILGGIFVCLGYWSRTKPTVALITGLCVFVLMHLLITISDPALMIKGIFFKIFMVIYLVKGIKSSIEADRMIKEHNFTSYR